MAWSKYDSEGVIPDQKKVPYGMPIFKFIEQKKGKEGPQQLENYGWCKNKKDVKSSPDFII